MFSLHGKVSDSEFLNLRTLKQMLLILVHVPPWFSICTFATKDINFMQHNARFILFSIVAASMSIALKPQAVVSKQLTCCPQQPWKVQKYFLIRSTERLSESDKEIVYRYSTGYYEPYFLPIRYL